MRLLSLAALCLMACATTRATAQTAECRADNPSWPHWDRYASHFISPEGRVVDRTDKDRTTSEGQSYGMFFALVQNDRARFDQLLRWTQTNLAKGDLSKHLPAWLWGDNGKGRWKVLDQNSASDSDLWIAYDLLEAARLWNEPRYQRIGQAMLKNIRKKEVANLPELGSMLLPGPVGFEHEKGHAWRLNPSYLPVQLLRRIAEADPTGPWNDVLANTVRMVQESSPHGLVADWVLYRNGTFESDPVKGSVGSYDAIRVYLWAGMLVADDPAREALLKSTGGLFRHWLERGTVPEKVDTRSDQVAGRAPPGFTAALMPIAQLQSNGYVEQLDQQLAETQDDGLYGQPAAYYDQNLILFAHGFVEGRFHFASNGSVVPRWGAPCAGR